MFLRKAVGLLALTSRHQTKGYCRPIKDSLFRACGTLREKSIKTISYSPNII